MQSTQTDFWDAQVGMTPYFVETDAYLYFSDQYTGLSVELERDFVLTQKLIGQPYLDVEMIFHDETLAAKKSGLSQLNTGLKPRYEVNKNVRPYVDIGYQYTQGRDQVFNQSQADSTRNWRYGVGIQLQF